MNVWKHVMKINVILNSLNVLQLVWLIVGFVERMEWSVWYVRMGSNCKGVINVLNNV